jgi:hypothetical protein
MKFVKSKQFKIPELRRVRNTDIRRIMEAERHIYIASIERRKTSVIALKIFKGCVEQVDIACMLS